MDAALLKKVLEGAIFAAGKPINIEQLGLLFDEAERPSNTDLREALEALKADYAERGVELKEVATGFRFQVRQETGPWVSRLWEEKPARYSRALLETLALIAYRQPITRSEIEEIRGVSVSSHIVKTLIEREWIRVAGHRDVPGRPALFATTREFLDHFNLKSLAELPSLAEIRDLERINEELFAMEAEAADALPDDGAAGDDHGSDEGEAEAVTLVGAAAEEDALAEVMAGLEEEIAADARTGLPPRDDAVYE